MIIVYKGGITPQVIRPCPLISLTWNASQNKGGTGGGSYSITLTGTILDDEGSPFVTGGASPANIATFSGSYEPRPVSQVVPTDEKLGSILKKQIALRELFADKCNKIEVLPISGNEPVFTFYPKFVSINFDQGVWVNTCNYTIELEAGFLLDKDNKIIGAGSYGATEGITLNEYINQYGGFVEDFSENWSIEPEEGNGNTYDPSSSPHHTMRTYRVTRTLSATGKRGAGSDCNDENNHPVIQAKKFVHKYRETSFYPHSNNSLGPHIASGTINLATEIFGGYNHLSTETIDKTAGAYTLNDTWLLSSGTAYENYSLSLSSSITDTVSTVSVNGTIKGLTSAPASGSIFGGNDITPRNTPYQNAALKYYSITNNGAFGPNCHIFRRAQNLTNLILNHQPLSVSLGTNEFTGEITYNIEYNDRPSNLVSGVLSESISVSDTYPGDVFAVIPVIGRATGPVLQYIGGRTEYQRSVSIDLVMDRKYYQNLANIPNPNPSQVRNFGILSKPSLVEPFRSQINSIVSAYSPAQEIGVRKYFLSPPTETWDAKSGSYSLSLNWTYELNT
jgi:hypothetical protein